MSPRVRLWHLVAVFALAHFVLALASLLTSYTLGMSRFNGGVFLEPSAAERVAAEASDVLFEPAASILRALGPGSRSSFAQWLALACNSLLWGLVLALVCWRLARRSTPTPTGGASPPPSGPANSIR